MTVVHPDLALGRLLPPLSFGPRSSRLLRRLPERPGDPGPGVTVTTRTMPGPPGAPDVDLRVLRPSGATAPVPALLWVHGGGHLFGSAHQDDRANAAFVRDLGITVASVRYRLGPDAPAPAAAEDAHAGLLGLVRDAVELGVDVDRIAVGGASAGGGIAAAAVLLAHDRGQVRPAFQLLVYPMLDDRTATRTDLPRRGVRVWTARSNRYGWTTYLGAMPGGPGVTPYAAPARREDLSGLPPAWIGVGSVDLFHDEDVAYARRLTANGVPCELRVVPGAFHGFDALFPRAGVSRQFWSEQAEALRVALLTR